MVFYPRNDGDRSLPIPKIWFFYHNNNAQILKQACRPRSNYNGEYADIANVNILSDLD